MLFRSIHLLQVRNLQDEAAREPMPYCFHMTRMYLELEPAYLHYLPRAKSIINLQFLIMIYT